MEPVRHRRFHGCSLARDALQHGSDATSPACADSVLLRAIALHCARHTFAATEKIVSPSTASTDENRRSHSNSDCFRLASHPYVRTSVIAMFRQPSRL